MDFKLRSFGPQAAWDSLLRRAGRMTRFAFVAAKGARLPPAAGRQKAAATKARGRGKPHPYISYLLKRMAL